MLFNIAAVGIDCGGPAQKLDRTGVLSMLSGDHADDVEREKAVRLGLQHFVAEPFGLCKISGLDKSNHTRLRATKLFLRSPLLPIHGTKPR